MSDFGVSGFTFRRNAVALGYPLRQSILSILPVVGLFTYRPTRLSTRNICPGSSD